MKALIIIGTILFSYGILVYLFFIGCGKLNNDYEETFEKNRH